MKGSIMKTTRIIIAAMLAGLMLLATACGTEPTGSPVGNTPSAGAQTTPGATVTPMATPDNVANVDGVFVVSDKKYDYDGKNIVIMNVENTSDKAYSIEITASYKSAGGKSIKSEVISFEGFAPNWSNYFVLNPQISFDKFEFELKATPYSGPVLADKVHLDTKYPLYIAVLLQDEIGFIQDIKPITEATEKDIQKGTITFDLTSYVTSPTPITFWSTAVAFNSNGEIVAIAPDRMHYKIGNNTNANNLSYKGISLDIDTSDIEMLKGVTSIGCLLSIDYDE